MHSFLEILIFLPTFGAFIGWLCKLVAIRMLFAPSKFVGIGPIGWQGVVQRQAPKFAEGVADTVERAGLSVEGLLSKVDPNAVMERFGPLLDKHAHQLLESAVEAVKPGSWADFADVAREQMAEQISSEGRRVGAVLLEEMRPEIAKRVDIRSLVVARLSGENADRLAALFQRIARNELRIVIWYGAVLGFFIGLVEVFFYAWLERWWLLPLVGAIDGLVNNWLAIQMIFRPYQRTMYLGVFPFQGLFPARQHEISKEYGEMMANDVLAPRDVVEFVWQKDGDTLAKQALAIVDRELSMMMMMLPMLLGVELDEAKKADVVKAIGAKMLPVLESEEAEITQFVREQLGIEQTLDDMLKIMPKEEFERVLRGIFEEDEWILITLGGFLGGVIGLMQGAIVLYLD